MTAVIVTLIRRTVKFATILFQFLLIVALGLLAAILAALPWLLRIAALLTWLFAAWFGLNAIQTIYSPFTDEIPLMALKGALILAQVSWLGLMILAVREHVWGGLALGAIVVGGLSWLAITVSENWQYAYLFFRVLPPALFSVLLIYETIHLRSIRRGDGIHLSDPAIEYLGGKTQSTNKQVSTSDSVE
jgi:hypothetical protein